jgi:hypothetical protein
MKNLNYQHRRQNILSSSAASDMGALIIKAIALNLLVSALLAFVKIPRHKALLGRCSLRGDLPDPISIN